MSQISLEKVLQNHFGIKHVVLVEPEPHTYDDGIRFLTLAGEKAYAKLVSLIYDLQDLLGEDVVDADEIIEELDDIRDGHTYRLSESDVVFFNRKDD